MNNAKHAITQEEGDTQPTDEQGGAPAGGAGQTTNAWVYPPGAGMQHSQGHQYRAPAIRRRLYADYRELLALEASARKLDFLGTDGARSVLPEQQTHSPERASAAAEGANGSAPGSSPVDAGGQGTALLESTIDQPVLIAVDQRTSMFFGSRKNFKSVLATDVAGLVAWQVFGRQRLLSAVIFNDRKIVQFAPGRGRLHTLLILQAMLNQNHTLPSKDGVCSNPGMLNDAMRRISKRSGSGAVVFFITDASGANEDTFRLATNISAQNTLFIILVYDAEQAEFCRPSSFFDDASLSRLAVRRGARFLREKNQSPAERQRFLAGRLFPNEIAVIPLNTRDDVMAQLRRAFSKSALEVIAKARPSQTELVAAAAPI